MVYPDAFGGHECGMGLEEQLQQRLVRLVQVRGAALPRDDLAPQGADPLGNPACARGERWCAAALPARPESRGDRPPAGRIRAYSKAGSSAEHTPVVLLVSESRRRRHTGAPQSGWQVLVARRAVDPVK